MKLLNVKKVMIIFIMFAFLTNKVWADNPPHVPHKLATMLLQAVALMGVSYHWGGNTPSSGLDCSGFVRYVFKKSLGITLPRTAAEMAKVGSEVDISDLQPGDLLFFNTRHTRNHYMGISHIGIYLGENKFIQAPHTGEQIQVTDFAGYWRAHFILAKRIDEKLINESSSADEDQDSNESEDRILEDIPDDPAHYSLHHRKGHHDHKSGRHGHSSANTVNHKHGGGKPTASAGVTTKSVKKTSTKPVAKSKHTQSSSVVKAHKKHHKR